jgi:hypothetical protein
MKVEFKARVIEVGERYTSEQAAGGAGFVTKHNPMVTLATADDGDIRLTLASVEEAREFAKKLYQDVTVTVEVES